MKITPLVPALFFFNQRGDIIIGDTVSLPQTTRLRFEGGGFFPGSVWGGPGSGGGPHRNLPCGMDGRWLIPNPTVVGIRRALIPYTKASPAILSQVAIVSKFSE